MTKNEKSNLEIIKNDNTMTELQHSLITGTILGDAAARTNKNGTAVWRFKQGTIHKEYILHIFNILKNVTNYIEPKFTTSLDSNNLPVYGNYYFETKSSQLLNAYFKLFFTFNVNTLKWDKVIPSFESMMILLTPIALSFWIQDDGSRTPSGLVLCTDSFSLELVELLVKVLTVKFGLACTIRKTSKLKTQYRIYIRARSIPMVRFLTQEFIHESMLYKIA